MVLAQKTIKEYVTKTKSEKIKKSIVMEGQPVTSSPKSFKDGHSKWPLLTSTDQLPDTIALITFHINDLGVTSYTKGYYATFIDNFSVSEEGGNFIANEMYTQTISTLKEEFAKHGVVLLTPTEFLDTPEKRSFYYDEFSPKVSKLGKFLSGVENRSLDISVAADYYRYFDMGASYDYLRCESLGFELANKLDVDGVLSIGFTVQSNSKEIYFRNIRVALHGPNPIPRLDKKYVAQKSGNGYNTGQLYAGGYLNFKDPFKIAVIKRKQMSKIDIDGLEIVLSNFIEHYYNVMNYAIEKASK
jgi:hypothetical protein